METTYTKSFNNEVYYYAVEVVKTAIFKTNYKGDNIKA